MARERRGWHSARVRHARQKWAGQWAKVETQHSFLNWVVGAVTLGIFTPMDVRIWCSE